MWEKRKHSPTGDIFGFLLESNSSVSIFSWLHFYLLFITRRGRWGESPRERCSSCRWDSGPWLRDRWGDTSCRTRDRTQLTPAALLGKKIIHKRLTIMDIKNVIKANLKTCGYNMTATDLCYWALRRSLCRLDTEAPPTESCWSRWHWLRVQWSPAPRSHWFLWFGPASRPACRK